MHRNSKRKVTYSFNDILACNKFTNSSYLLFHDGDRYHMDWFLYDNGLRHERVNIARTSNIMAQCICAERMEKQISIDSKLWLILVVIAICKFFSLGLNTGIFSGKYILMTFSLVTCFL